MKFLTGPFSANNPVIVQILGICSALGPPSSWPSP